eukprot:gnl/MRDRNA2_/MRDRNA2_181228_c0_seq1.p1 gnl/MRDRNA2_/MRDRNA2_181228_c0~~gnl/MRDRNA2_/MRDRNA2_181228_c0_seq1.p1  ORF type:complete len:338 (-),score=59.15 gnl/MRDRNA2_/MRDRNA2_181228_c0_seq1:282-1295(-)
MEVALNAATGAVRGLVAHNAAVNGANKTRGHDRAESDKHGNKKKVHSIEVGPRRRQMSRWGAALTRSLDEDRSIDKEISQLESKLHEHMERHIHDVFKYDDIIKKDQFKQLVIVLSRGEPVEDVEVDWVMAMVDPERTGIINRRQLPEIKAAVAKYIIARAEVKEKFEKYDTEGLGILTRENMRNVLTDLNDGIRVSDEEVQAVMKAASNFRSGFVAVPEFQGAINLWYNEVHLPQQIDLGRQRDRCKGGIVGRTRSSLLKVGHASRSASAEGSPSRPKIAAKSHAREKHKWQECDEKVENRIDSVVDKLRKQQGKWERRYGSILLKQHNRKNIVSL